MSTECEKEKGERKHIPVLQSGANEMFLTSKLFLLRRRKRYSLFLPRLTTNDVYFRCGGYVSMTVIIIYIYHIEIRLAYLSP